MGRLFQRRGCSNWKSSFTPRISWGGFRKKQFGAGAERTGWDIRFDETCTNVQILYKYNNILPQSFDGLFINHQSNHNYNTRNKDDYRFHMFRLNTILNTSPKIWNNLPKHIKCSKTLGQFKRKIVSYLILWISQLHFRSGKLVIDFSYGQNTKCNLVFNDESFHVHAY